MNKLNERVDKLEATQGIGQDVATAYFFHELTADDQPSENLPRMVWVSGTDEQFLRQDYESDEAFIAAADECHMRIHGQPLRMVEGIAA